MADWQLAAQRAAKRHGVDPKVMVALVNAESGGNPNARSPAGAQGIAQFMPATAKGYGVNLNDNRISDDLDGAARYLAANLKRTGGDYKAALSIYNSGRPDGYKSIPETKNYVAKILGNAGSYPAHSMAQAAGVTTTTRTTGPAVTPEGMSRGALLAQYLATRGRPGALAGLGAELGTLKAPVTTTTTRSPAIARVSMGGGTGQFKIVGANPGRLKPHLVSFAEKVAGVYGQSLTGDSGATHSKMTVDGNVSDHWAGNATDIPATGRKLISMGRAALIAAGMPRAQAMKQTGGLYNVGGHQVIFNTHLGGDHTNHLHISAR